MSCGCDFNWRSISRKVFDYLGNTCCWYIFPLDLYCTVIAICGLVCTSSDIYRVLVDGPVLSDSVWPMRSADADKPVSDEKERDFKLIFAVIEWTVYCCLFVAAYHSSPLFLLPYVWIRVILLCSAIFVCSVNLITQKPMTLSIMGLVGRILEIHNILYASCLFKKLVFGSRP